MNPGDVVLVRLPQVGTGPSKLRPAVYLTTLPGPYQDGLVCGISTQLQNILLDWDELVQPGEADFSFSGLVQASAIRLSYLRAVASTEIVGLIGKIDQTRLLRLRQRLSDHLRP